MTHADKQRLFAALLGKDSALAPERRACMAEELTAMAADTDDHHRGCLEIGHELRTAAHQLAGSIPGLTGCTAEQRFELRQLATFLLRRADILAPITAVYDPDRPAPVVQLRRGPGRKSLVRAP